MQPNITICSYYCCCYSFLPKKKENSMHYRFIHLCAHHEIEFVHFQFSDVSITQSTKSTKWTTAAKLFDTNNCVKQLLPKNSLVFFMFFFCICLNAFLHSFDLPNFAKANKITKNNNNKKKKNKKENNKRNVHCVVCCSFFTFLCSSYLLLFTQSVALF